MHHTIGDTMQNSDTTDPRPVALVIDDDPTMRLIASRTLESAGLRAVVASDAEKGLDLFHQVSPAIVLMDVMMPGIDGYAATERLRATPAGQHVPVLMLTGLDDLDSINRAYEAGATDFVSKPINWGVLGHRVRYILRAAEALQGLAENQALLAAAQQVAHLGSWSWDFASGATRWSDETYRIFGYNPGECEAGRDAFLGRLNPEDVDLVQSSLEALRKRGTPMNLMARLKLPDGTTRYLQVTSEVVRNEAGEPAQAFGALQDITDSKTAEQRIHQLAAFDRLTQLPNRQRFAESTSTSSSASTTRSVTPWVTSCCSPSRSVCGKPCAAVTRSRDSRWVRTAIWRVWAATSSACS